MELYCASAPYSVWVVVEIGIACFIIFLIMAALMYSRRISALLALPIMAVVIAAIGQIPPPDILKDVISGGVTKLNNAYTTSMIGAVLAELINKLGIAKAMVRWVAEFSGDSPFALGLLMTLVTALLFSSLGGLGAVIMVGTVVLPVMLSLGISAATAGGLFLFGISLGGMFNLATWTLLMGVVGIPQEAITSYVVPFAGILIAILIGFLTIELRKASNLKYALASLLALGGLAFAAMQSGGLAPKGVPGAPPPGPDPNSLSGSVVALGILILIAIWRHSKKATSLPSLAFLTPGVPLLLVLLFHWDIISAFIAGITYGVLVAWRRDSVNLFTRSIIEGAQSVIPAVVLMMGIGMLLNAVMHKKIAAALEPLITAVLPHDGLSYLVLFTVIAPLALYRGPLSVWGMGSGLVGLMKAPLGGPATMAMLLSVGQLQGICDPTNTHNVWIATYLGTDTQVLLRKTIPYAWFSVICGLALAIGLGYK
jgi:Na+/H+ antiporter NhaD/arsenite permease-like protein